MMKHVLNTAKRVPQSRLVSPVFWAALIAQLFSILFLTGVIDSGEEELLNNIGCALLELLVAFGIFNDPTNGAAV